MFNCKWLPDLEPYTSSKEWKEYEDFIYGIFRNDFIVTYPNFENKRVKIRYHPIEFGKEEAFFHVTCQDYLKDGERVPDFRRCERIRWVRKFIENYDCSENCEPCDGVKVWYKLYKNNQRIHILMAEEKYMVVIEKRENYCLLITAYYIEREHTLRKKITEYNRYEQSKKRLL